MAMKVTTAQKPAGYWMPTKTQLTKIYKGISDAAFKSGTAKKVKGPPVKDPNKYPSYDITPKGLMDVNRTLFVIKGEIYHRTSGMSPTGIGSVWHKIGPAPLF